MDLAERNLARRLAAGAADINLPEVHIAVDREEITFTPIVHHRSSTLVRECMLVAGEAAAHWALTRRLAFPYTAQERGELPEVILPGYAGAYQLRSTMRPRRLSTEPGAHGGLGLELYSQVTSPLRRYSDLLAHLQIRAALRGEEALEGEEVLLRLGAAESAALAAAQAERASRAHWTAVYLSRREGEIFEASALAKKGERWVVLIPALGLETQMLLPPSVKPNDLLKVAVKGVNIPRGETFFALV
jgi:exoribonuclease-2